MKFNSKFSKEQEVLDSIITFVKLTDEYEMFDRTTQDEICKTYKLAIEYCERSILITIDFTDDSIIDISCKFNDIIHVGRLGYARDVNKKIFAHRIKENFYPVLKEIEGLVVNGYRNIDN